jgi:tRNA(Ile)-lysidine synthetase-like protein
MTACPPDPESSAARNLLGLLRPGERDWWVAVSGGADSTFLLLTARLAAAQVGARLGVVHLNHGWRGAESDHDEAFVRNLALGWGLDLRVAVFTPSTTQVNRLDWARRCRRALLESLAGPDGVILLGHQAGDQSETVLAGLLEGRAPWGVHALRERNACWIRPLLALPADVIKQRLRQLGIPWREDRSNRDTTRLRGWLRHEVLAPLRRGAPEELDLLLGRVAHGLMEAGDFRHQHLVELLDNLDLRPVPGGTSLERAGFLPYHEPLSGDLLRLLGRQLGLWGRDPTPATLQAWARMLAEGRPGRRIPLGRATWMDLGRTRAWLLRRLPTPQVRLMRPGGRQLLGGVELGWGTPPPDARLGPILAGQWLAARTWLPGDCWENGKSLAERMGRLGYPPARKSLQPVVVSNNHVVWAPGLDPDHAPDGHKDFHQPRVWVRPCN